MAARRITGIPKVIMVITKSLVMKNIIAQAVMKMDMVITINQATKNIIVQAVMTMDMETKIITGMVKEVTKNIIAQAEMTMGMEVQVVMIKEVPVILENTHTQAMFIIHPVLMIKTAQKVMVKRVVKKKVIVLKVMKAVTMIILMRMILMTMEIMNLKDLVIVDLMRNKNMSAMVVVANIIRTVKGTMVDSHMLVKLTKTLSIKLF